MKCCFRHNTGHLIGLIAFFILIMVVLYDNLGEKETMNDSLYKIPTTSIASKEIPLPWWDGGDGCGCNQTYLALEGTDGGSCSRRAWSSGYGQRVIAYTLFGTSRNYYKGLGEILQQAEKLYPAYYVRLYTETSSQIKPILCPMICRFPKFHVCNVRDLPQPLGDMSKKGNDPRMWRFLPIGDPQVEVLLVRDTDSKIIPRELAAVEEWLQSGLALHTMGDHPKHHPIMLAGMWGVRAELNSRQQKINNQQQLALLRDRLLKESKGIKKHHFNDQHTLKDVMWEALKNSSMRHESYNCKEFPNSRPYPTRRDGLNFVGAQWYRSKGILNKNWICPAECRPSHHQDWLYC